VATGWPRGNWGRLDGGDGPLRSSAKRVALGWRLGGTCGTWANKAPPAKPLSCKALWHVWRVWHLFLTLIRKQEQEDDVLPHSGKADRAVTTRHTCHTCLKPVWRKGFRVRRFGSTCSTQAPPCTQSATLPVATGWPQGWPPPLRSPLAPAGVTCSGENVFAG